MKIALYHPWIKSRGGSEKVLLEILNRSSHEIVLFTLFYDRDNSFEGFERHDIRVLGSNRPPRGFVSKAIRFGLGSLFATIPTEYFDLFVVSESGLGSLITLRNNDIPVLGYIHTPLRAALPEFRETYRKEVNSLLRPIYDSGIIVYNFLEKRAWRNFDRVVVNSELTRNRIREKDIFPGEMGIIPPGVDTEQFETGKFQKYFLYPSRFRRYKRQHLAIQAFQEADVEGFELILAGAAQEKEYVKELRDMANEKITILTDVSEEKWTELYENSYAILFLAKAEDWGIVPLEAMAAGKPIIAANEGGYGDLIDSEVGVLVESAPSDIANAMEYLVESDVRNLGERGRERVKAYDWKYFIERFEGEIDEI